MGHRLKRKQPDEAESSSSSLARSAPNQEIESDALARQLSRELNASVRAKRRSERYAPSTTQSSAEQTVPRVSSRRAQASVVEPPKGQPFVGKVIEIFWVVSPEDGEQRAATQTVVKSRSLTSL